MKVFSFFRRKKASPLPSPTAAPASLEQPPQPATFKTLVIVYDPVVEPASRKKLSEYMHWNRVADLMEGYTSDILQVSGGLVRYQIVERIDVDTLPVKADGYTYDVQTYLKVMRRAAPPHMPDQVDYYAILHQFDILQRVARAEIDEVWLFGFPYAGFYESIMGGPDAFWCNAPPLQNTETSRRRFVVMGFSYERGVGEMLEDLGHRAESIMEKTFEKLAGEANLWRRFIRYEKTHPGKAALGNVHFAPNSNRDYDWGNPSTVISECDDWLHNFPNFKGITRKVTSADWGYGDIRKHHVWWLKHFPKVGGLANGILHNWWHYIANPNNVNE